MASELRRQIEDFYYLEAELLDERKLREWFNLLTEDVRYWMPLRHNTMERPSDVVEELSQPGDGYYFDDDIKSLKIRVERAYSKIAWAEVPPSRTRHLIGNLVAEPLDNGEVRAKTAFLVYRSHLETDHQLLAGSREDVLRRVNGAWKIAKRTILLDANVLLDKNLSIFL